MTKILLGLNCNTLVNRYTEPLEWPRIVGEELSLRFVQFSTDLLDPYLPFAIQRRIIKETLEYCKRCDVTIKSSFGGHFSHQHYLGHPDKEVRREAERWYARAIWQAASLGAEGFGVCFAIMTVRDNADPRRRREILEDAIASYHRLALEAKKEGLKYLAFEAMSVERESVATIKEAQRLLDACSDMAVPMKICLDVGHRNPASGNPKDADPCAWIRALGRHAPVIHIQQTDETGSLHGPFTREANRSGIIRPGEIIRAINEYGADEVLLAFEITTKAFHPHEDRHLEYWKESVRYWRRFL